MKSSIVRLRPRFYARQQDLKRSTFAGFARNLDRSMETPNDPMHNGKPEAPAEKFLVEERGEDLGWGFGRHPPAGVGPFQLQIIDSGQCLRHPLRLP